MLHAGFGRPAVRPAAVRCCALQRPSIDLAACPHWLGRLPVAAGATAGAGPALHCSTRASAPVEAPAQPPPPCCPPCSPPCCCPLRRPAASGSASGTPQIWAACPHWAGCATLVPPAPAADDAGESSTSEKCRLSSKKRPARACIDGRSLGSAGRCAGSLRTRTASSSLSGQASPLVGSGWGCDDGSDQSVAGGGAPMLHEGLLRLRSRLRLSHQRPVSCLLVHHQRTLTAGCWIFICRWSWTAAAPGRWRADCGCTPLRSL